MNVIVSFNAENRQYFSGYAIFTWRKFSPEHLHGEVLQRISETLTSNFHVFN